MGRGSFEVFCALGIQQSAGPLSGSVTKQIMIAEGWTYICSFEPVLLTSDSELGERGLEHGIHETFTNIN